MKIILRNSLVALSLVAIINLAGCGGTEKATEDEAKSSMDSMMTDMPDADPAAATESASP